MPEAEDKKAAKGGAKKAGDGAAKTGAAKKAAPRGAKSDASPRAEKPPSAPINTDGYTPRLKKHYDEVALIAGQKAVVTRARKAISQFKVRENMPIGCKVTLRKTRMYEFLDRLVNVALPRVRDFRGLNPKSFDGRGNYALGIKEHLVFPEINYDRAEAMWGMDIVVATTAKTDDEARALLKHFNFPFRQ